MTVERFPIEAGHIMMFARAIGDDNPVYYDEALAARGRQRADIEMVGGIRGHFTDANDVASLEEALAGVREQLAAGYATICFKPSMFTDEMAAVPEVCRRVVEFLSSPKGA